MDNLKQTLEAFNNPEKEEALLIHELALIIQKYDAAFVNKTLKEFQQKYGKVLTTKVIIEIKRQQQTWSDSSFSAFNAPSTPMEYAEHILEVLSNPETIVYSNVEHLINSVPNEFRYEIRADILPKLIYNKYKFTGRDFQNFYDLFTPKEINKYHETGQLLFFVRCAHAIKNIWEHYKAN